MRQRQRSRAPRSCRFGAQFDPHMLAVRLSLPLTESPSSTHRSASLSLRERCSLEVHRSLDFLQAETAQANFSRQPTARTTDCRTRRPLTLSSSAYSAASACRRGLASTSSDASSSDVSAAISSRRTAFWGAVRRTRTHARQQQSRHDTHQLGCLTSFTKALASSTASCHSTTTIIRCP